MKQPQIIYLGDGEVAYSSFNEPNLGIAVKHQRYIDQFVRFGIAGRDLHDVALGSLKCEG